MIPFTVMFGVILSITKSISKEFLNYILLHGYSFVKCRNITMILKQEMMLKQMRIHMRWA